MKKIFNYLILLKQRALCFPLLIALSCGLLLALITYPKAPPFRQDATTATAQIVAAYRETLPSFRPPDKLVEVSDSPIYILKNDGLEHPHPQGGMLISGVSLVGKVWQSANIQVTPGRKYILTYDTVPYVEGFAWIVGGSKMAAQDLLPPLYSGIRQLPFIPGDETVTISLFAYGSKVLVKTSAWVKLLRLDACHD